MKPDIEIEFAPAQLFVPWLDRCNSLVTGYMTYGAKGLSDVSFSWKPIIYLHLNNERHILAESD